MSHWFAEDRRTDLHQGAVPIQTVPASLHVPRRLPARLTGTAEGQPAPASQPGLALRDTSRLVISDTQQHIYHTRANPAVL